MPKATEKITGQHLVPISVPLRAVTQFPQRRVPQIRRKMEFCEKKVKHTETFEFALLKRVRLNSNEVNILLKECQEKINLLMLRSKKRSKTAALDSQRNDKTCSRENLRKSVGNSKVFNGVKNMCQKLLEKTKIR